MPRRVHIAMCLRVLRDALVSQRGRALLQARGLWLEQLAELLGRAQPVIPPNLYSNVNEHNSLGPQVTRRAAMN